MACWGTLLIACAFAGPVPTTTKPAHYPDWWFERDVVVRKPDEMSNSDPQWPQHYNAPDDFAVANIGQLKMIAMKAAEEMDARLPPLGAGPAVQTLVAGWNPLAGGTNRDDYAVVNQGQLKHVAQMFYERLADLSYPGPPLFGEESHPWGQNAESPADNYAAVNLGQLKHVFSFVPLLAAPSGPTEDRDNDGLPDVWEIAHWGNLLRGPNDDSDADGVDNLSEYYQGRNPLKGAVADTDGAVALTVHRPGL
jgi:hypothetical protein